jgi:serine-threonine kinase receptor-associated protein
MRTTATVCPGHSRPVVGAHFATSSRDGGRAFMVSASLDKRPMLRDAGTGDWIGTFEGHKGAVWSARLNRGATLAATGSADFTARVWDAIDGSEKMVLKHRHIVKSVDFSRDGARLATGARDKKLRVYDLSHVGCAGGAESTDEADGGGGNGETEATDPMMTLDHPKGVTRVLWTKDPNLVVTGCEDGGLRTWDLRSAEVTQCLELGPEVADLDLSQDDSTLAAANGNVVRFYDASRPGNVSLLKEHTCKLDVKSVSIHPEKSQFITAGTDLWVYVWDFETQKEVAVKKGHHGPVHFVSWDTTGSSFASGADDATLRLWKVVKE